MNSTKQMVAVLMNSIHVCADKAIQMAMITCFRGPSRSDKPKAASFNLMASALWLMARRSAWESTGVHSCSSHRRRVIRARGFQAPLSFLTESMASFSFLKRLLFVLLPTKKFK